MWFTLKGIIISYAKMISFILDHVSCRAKKMSRPVTVYKETPVLSFNYNGNDKQRVDHIVFSPRHQPRSLCELRYISKRHFVVQIKKITCREKTPLGGHKLANVTQGSAFRSQRPTRVPNSCLISRFRIHFRSVLILC